MPVRSLTILGGALMLLAACAQENRPELALACQTRPCTCVPADRGLFAKPIVEPAPIHWRSNGDAYCDEGFVLSLVEEKKKR